MGSLDDFFNLYGAVFGWLGGSIIFLGFIVMLYEMGKGLWNYFKGNL